MKTNRIRWSLLAFTAAVLSAGAARSFAEKLTAEVPFKFQVQDQQFPPGEYTISDLPGASGTHVLLLRNWEARKSTLVLPRSLEANSGASRARMVFKCRDGNCALSEIWGATAGGGITVQPPREYEHAERTSFVYLTRQKSGH